MIESFGREFEEIGKDISEKTLSFLEKLESSIDAKQPEGVKSERSLSFLEKLESSINAKQPEGAEDAEAAKDHGKGLESDVQDNEQVEKGDAEKKHLTDEEKEVIKKDTGWSDEVIDHIQSMEQYEIYKNADLHEVEVNGRRCLVKNIDPDYVDPKTGKTNRELMEKGRSPIDAKTGEKIELHHMGQDFKGPFAELCENSEHGDGNHTTLHDKEGESWRQDPEHKKQYENHDRPNHWKARAQEAE